MPHFASLLTSAVVALSMAGGVVAGPGSNNGQASYYQPNGGIGNCGGKPLQNGDFIVALPNSAYAGGSNCGKKIRITYKGKTEVGTVRDRCPGCPGNQIDLSEGLFKQFEKTSVGILKPIQWQVVG